MRVLRLLWAGIVAAGGAVVSLAQLNLPKGFWVDLAVVQYAAVAVVAIAILDQTVRAVTRSVGTRRVQEFERDLWATQSATVAELVGKFQVPWDEIGVRVYWAHRVWGRQTLVRVSGVRAGAPVTDLPATIRPGVGVAGIAFEDGRSISVRWEALVRTATRDGRDAWERRPRAQRFGLNWGQVQAPVFHMENLLAQPFFDGRTGRSLGCVLISGPSSLPDLTRPEMRTMIGSLVTAILLIGPPPAEWWRSRD